MRVGVIDGVPLVLGEPLALLLGAALALPLPVARLALAAGETLGAALADAEPLGEPERAGDGVASRLLVTADVALGAPVELA